MGTTIKILILEDNFSDAELIQRELRKGGLQFTAQLAQNREAFYDTLKEFSPNIILADYSLPEFDGLSALKLVRKHFPEIPVIIVSGAIGEEKAIETLKAGAIDYVLKDKLKRLVPVVNRAINETKVLIERRKAEKAVRRQARLLKKYNETLEERIRMRTEEVSTIQTKLEMTKRLSDIGTLAMTVAHELRNPLATIGIAVHNIRCKANDTIFENHLASIDKKIAESDQIINNLLFYSRLKPPQFEKFDVFDALEESIGSIENKKQKGISIIRDTDSLKDLSIEADPLQMREVFVNILNNAHDAVPVDNGEIKIGSKVSDKYLTISIEDNGSGISQNIVDKIFDPFFTTKAKGMGLGLSVCKQIVTMHDGEIRVKQGLLKGTCIVVRIPKERTLPGNNDK